MRKRMKFGGTSLLAAVAVPLLLGWISSASAQVTATFDTWKGSGTAPSSPPFGTVTLTQVGSNVNVSVSVNPNEFTMTGAGESLLFDLHNSAPPGGTISPITITGLTSGFSVDGGTGSGTITATAGSIHADGTGTWQYGIICSECGGGPNPGVDAFSFTIDNITILDFAKNPSTGFLFAADICAANAPTDTTCIKTGDVATNGPSNVPFTPLPEPSTLALFGSALLGLGLIGRSRRRRS